MEDRGGRGGLHKHIKKEEEKERTIKLNRVLTSTASQVSWIFAMNSKLNRSSFYYWQRDMLIVLFIQGRIQDFFLGGGALVSCSTSTPINHSFFLENTSCIIKPQVISGGGGAHMHPPPRSAPVICAVCCFSRSHIDEQFSNFATEV